jgi:hypothetical protein
MKTIAMIAFMVLCAGSLKAYEIPENPDRKISFGLNYDRTSMNSEYTFGSFKVSDFTKLTQDQFILDARIPLSSIFTLGLRGGYLSTKNDIFTGEKTTATGYDIGFGLRFYIP